MASSSSSGPACSVSFSTQTKYPLPSQKFMIPAAWKRYQLSQLINKALSLDQPVPFDFLVRGEILRGSISEWCSENGVGEEETLDIEYIESVVPPQKVSELPHDDWVSAVDCSSPEYFLTASYDGTIRAFDHSKRVIAQTQAHNAPITGLCVVPSSGDLNTTSRLVATSSHDMSTQLTRVSFEEGQTSSPLATLHLHTGPVSSISSDSSGSTLLTSSWDGLIASWDTSIPTEDEVPDPFVDSGERRKRRKVTQVDKPKRKAPLLVMKSHTARVSRVVFGPQNEKTAVSCGFDSTVRTWDVEMGLCTHTINASEKPFLDVVLTPDGNTALAASTDRTVTLYDIREASSATGIASLGSLSHPSTPSCLAVSASTQQIISGAYDGVARLWDVRSLKGAVVSFKAWDGQKKILSIDWKRGLVGIGGEGGLEIWRASESQASLS